MTHLSRLALFSTTAISLGCIVFLGSLTGEVISGGGGALMGEARATVVPASKASLPKIAIAPKAAPEATQRAVPVRCIARSSLRNS